MQGAGRRTERIVFSRIGAGVDAHGEEDGSWTDLGAAYATVFWGNGSEQRNVAQQGGSQAASFVVLSTLTTREVRIKDRLTYQGEPWDVQSIAPAGRTELTLNAVRAVA